MRIDPALFAWLNEPMKREPSSRMNVIRTILIAIPIIAMALFFKIASGGGKLLYFSKEAPSFMRATFFRFDDTKSRKVGLKPGDQLILSWEEVEEQGSLRLEIRDPDKVVLETLNDSVEDYAFTADRKGNYQLFIVGERARGSFSLRWDYIEK